MKRASIVLCFSTINIVEVLATNSYIKQSDRDDFRVVLHEYDTMVTLGNGVRLLNLPELKVFPFVPQPFTDKRKETFSDIAVEIMGSPLEDDDLECKEAIRKNKDTLPPIRIIGEAHTCPNCHVERLNRILDAREGKSIFSYEDSAKQENPEDEDNIEDTKAARFPDILGALPVSGTKAFGIDGFAGNLVDQIKIILNGHDERIKKQKIAPDANFRLDQTRTDDDANHFQKSLIVTFRLISETMQSKGREFFDKIAKTNPTFKNKFSTPLELAGKRIKAAIDANKNANGIEILLKEATAFLSQLTYEELGSMMEYYVKEAFAEAIASNKLFKKIKPKTYKLFTMKQPEHDDWELILEILEVPARNMTFANSIFHIYCTEALPKGKPLFVQMGSWHTEGVKFALENTLKNFLLPIPSIEISNEALKFITMPIEQREKHIDTRLSTIDSRMRAIHKKEDK